MIPRRSWLQTRGWRRDCRRDCRRGGGGWARPTLARVGGERAVDCEMSLELLGACVALEIVRARCAEPDHSEKAGGEHESHDTDR